MYKIVGADQKEYGPVTEEQVREWIAEGRANSQTIARLDDGPWKPLSTFPEFASLFTGPTMAAGAAVPTSPPLPPPPLPLTPLPGGVVPPTNGMAITGVVCGVLGLFCCGPLFSTLALIFSIIGLSQINQKPTQYSGKGVAMAGIVLGILGYVLFALLLFTGVLQRGFRHFPHQF